MGQIESISCRMFIFKVDLTECPQEVQGKFENRANSGLHPQPALIKQSLEAKEEMSSKIHKIISNKTILSFMMFSPSCCWQN